MNVTRYVGCTSRSLPGLVRQNHCHNLKDAPAISRLALRNHDMAEADECSETYQNISNVNRTNQSIPQDVIIIYCKIYIK